MEFKDVGALTKINKLNYRDLAIFLIPIIVFSVYLAVFNPCIATYDTFNQLHQIASGSFTNWHPFFHTFINMICLGIYPSTTSVCILQILTFSVMWMVICKYHRDDEGDLRKGFKLQVVLTVIICIIPINALYSITLWKDILFSYFLMFLCFLAKVMIDRQGKVDIKFILLLSIIMAFVAELRGNGLYVIIIVLAVYAIYLFMKKNRKMSIALAILTVTFILLIASLNVAYDVEDNEKDALATKLAHMLADYDLNLEMDDADRNQIHKLINKDKVKEAYKPTKSDPIFAITDYDEYDNNKGTYIGLAVKYSLKDPLHCLQYLFGASPMVWDITKDGDWMGRPYYMSGDRDRLQSDFNEFYVRHNNTPTEPYENLSYANWGTPAFDLLNSLALGIEASFFDTIFNSPALYMYLSIILLVMIHLITRTREIYLMYIPNVLNILAIFFSTPIQDYRYLYPNLLICYLLIIILIWLRYGSSDEPQISLNPMEYIRKLKN